MDDPHACPECNLSFTTHPPIRPDDFRTTWGSGFISDPARLDRQVRETSFRFYYGAASGAQRKALRTLMSGFEGDSEDLHVMISHATKNNWPWPGIKRLGIDCGGYSFMKSAGDYTVPDEAYLNYVARIQPEFFASRDYPCEQTVLTKRGATVADYQQATTEKALSMLELVDDYQITSDVMAVVQGQDFHEYVSHLDELRDHSVLAAVDRLGIGTLCDHGDAWQIRNIVVTVSNELDSDLPLQGFGIKRTALEYPAVVAVLDSADSLAYSMTPMYESITSKFGIPNDWKAEARAFLSYSSTITETIRKVQAGELSQMTLTDEAEFGANEAAEYGP